MTIKFFKVKRNAYKYVNGNNSLDSECLRRREEEEQGEERRKNSSYGMILTILKLLRFYK